MTQISLQSIQKSYGSSPPVIRDVDLQIEAGEFCVFLGPSGCGKSTLLRMIAGLETISAGELRIDNTLVNDVPPAKREVAMVFQNYALYPHMSLYDNMAFGLRQSRVDKVEIDKRVRAAAEVLQITHLLDRLPKALSGGQRQRVAIGRAIVRSPKLFLFDEPLSNLDAALRVHMRGEIAKLHRDFKSASMVYVTHDQTEAMALADKIVLLRAGQDMVTHGSVAQVGAPLDLYHRPNDLFVARFIGSPRMNLLPARVSEVVGGRMHLEIDATFGCDQLVLPVEGREIVPGSTLTLGIRPEHMTLAAAGETTITRKIQKVEHFGECSYVYLESPSGEDLIAKVPGHSCPPEKTTQSFEIDPHNFHIFDSTGFAVARRK